MSSSLCDKVRRNTWPRIQNCIFLNLGMYVITSVSRDAKLRATRKSCVEKGLVQGVMTL